MAPGLLRTYSRPRRLRYRRAGQLDALSFGGSRRRSSKGIMPSAVYSVSQLRIRLRLSALERLLVVRAVQLGRAFRRRAALPVCQTPRILGTQTYADHDADALLWARWKNSSGTRILARRKGVVGVVLAALYDDGASHTRIQGSKILVLWPPPHRPYALVGDDGGRPIMADAHEERALLDLCNANGLRLSTPSRARSAPCARAAYRRTDTGS